MKLSIIILNHNSAKLVKYLLKNIADLKFSMQYEIIVVDNSPQHELKEELRSYLPYIELIEIPNKGYANGNNMGIKKAQGEYILILNPDLYFKDNAIEKMIVYLDDHPNVGIIGPKLLYPNGHYQHSCTSFPNWRLPLYRRTKLGQTKKGKAWLQKYLMLDYDHQNTIKVDWLFGACLMVRQDAVNEIGLLDERFFMYFEDCDWCRRFWQKDWQVVYFAAAQVTHFHHRDSAGKSGIMGVFSKMGRIHLSSWFKYLWKWRNK
ncbi:MAG: hypothetical protein AUJ28_04135 [Parcubacteria group bacterium CG1_02_37_51]|uniref:Glycosyltransferase 2-like domain-containing protein n=2 Tax=Candidatus Komeiliibacteriota TaxID=1817908 RepID=A0A2M8DQM3_9BACT|nr:MAG: hypothetical protein AUJ28_04135 [Parcubacteria group bacterium CG1_02_37_51]PIY94537.1 MAG: hypothetical protein COY67_02395 [Candidatus Komeilibacteria bacterium CG_4_10_14_0_8_um_filter_37_78]PJC01466.1 MAG: hypothetical protein CO073_03475 [Candidatus Komeilibacteria bacterium CG_4_9_14_0_8_um_filter_36_9]